MSLVSGDRLGPYEIVSRLGAGGMGEVYKAHDARLDRVVAIKISAAEFSERFEREARAIAAFNHPHICALYDVGPNYLVMEYIEGSEIKGPLPLEMALRYAIQLAGALEAAHRKGITHRDLKPANILLTKSGVKVLDFGLARTEPSNASAAAEETLTQALTQQGAIVGTLQYMAPEQLQGRPADTRSDIFSFGCVLYEILTGKRAFNGASTASVIAAILERPAPTVAGSRRPTWIGRCVCVWPRNRMTAGDPSAMCVRCWSASRSRARKRSQRRRPEHPECLGSPRGFSRLRRWFSQSSCSVTAARCNRSCGSISPRRRPSRRLRLRSRLTAGRSPTSQPWMEFRDSGYARSTRRPRWRFRVQRTLGIRSGRRTGTRLGFSRVSVWSEFRSPAAIRKSWIEPWRRW